MRGIYIFALAAAGRFLLAFFIFYLVILEMPAINWSYTEDSYVNNWKT